MHTKLRIQPIDAELKAKLFKDDAPLNGVLLDIEVITDPGDTDEDEEEAERVEGMPLFNDSSHDQILAFIGSTPSAEHEELQLMLIRGGTAVYGLNAVITRGEKRFFVPGRANLQFDAYFPFFDDEDTQSIEGALYDMLWSIEQDDFINIPINTIYA